MRPRFSGRQFGLSISYGIVKDHGGTIDCESCPGLGTRFVVRLPVAPRGPLPRPADPGGVREPASPSF